jgi:hypothetical protein
MGKMRKRETGYVGRRHGSQSAVTYRLSSMRVPTHLFVPSILITYLERVILVQNRY